LKDRLMHPLQPEMDLVKQQHSAVVKNQLML